LRAEYAALFSSTPAVRVSDFQSFDGPPNVNSPSFSQICARISAELLAADAEQRAARLADPRYRKFLADSFRMSLKRGALCNDAKFYSRTKLGYYQKFV
jgi:hypothetical protein